MAVGAYLLPKTPDTAALVPTSETLHLALTAPQQLADSAHPQHAAVAAARAACQQARVLHWPLAFAQVFAAGGFDCVLGNVTPTEYKAWVLAGERATWPKIAMIRDQTIIGQTLEHCIIRLKKQNQSRVTDEAKAHKA